MTNPYGDSQLWLLPYSVYEINNLK